MKTDEVHPIRVKGERADSPWSDTHGDAGSLPWPISAALLFAAATVMIAPLSR